MNRENEILRSIFVKILLFVFSPTPEKEAKMRKKLISIRLRIIHQTSHDSLIHECHAKWLVLIISNFQINVNELTFVNAPLLVLAPKDTRRHQTRKPTSGAIQSREGHAFVSSRSANHTNLHPQANSQSPLAVIPKKARSAFDSRAGLRSPHCSRQSFLWATTIFALTPSQV